MFKFFKNILLSSVIMLTLTSCKTTNTALVPETMSPQEKEVYNVLRNVESGWAVQDFDKVFLNYADDGTFTGEKNAPVSKDELLALCNRTKDNWRITKMIIKKLVVQDDKATANTTLVIVVGGKERRHKENYELQKRDGTWLIVKEINP